MLMERITVHNDSEYKKIWCNNHMTSITCCYTYFKLYEVHFSVLLLTEDSFSQSGVPAQERFQPPCLRLF